MTVENAQIQRLKMAEAKLKAQNPVDLVTIAELRMAMGRIENGRPLMLDPITRAIVNSITVIRRPIKKNV